MHSLNIGVVGLGYVGLPLALECGKIHTTVGFDINKGRVRELIDGYDRTLEAEETDFVQAKKLTFSSDIHDLKSCNFYIVTVPTPVDEHKKPDLNPLINATTLLGSLLKKGDIVVYESTVFPGCTEEVCVPILEEKSGLKFNTDFYCGYSPERINPGDKTHRLTSIRKVTSGSTPAAAKIVDDFYASIIRAGTFLASSLKVAEAAKAIENAQRDINIAFVNELSLIFERLGIDTREVLEAAGTKWNFLNFSPGLVGGHCIGVDPYYLTYKAEAVGYKPQVILAGRKINDNMGAIVGQRVVKLLAAKKTLNQETRVLVLGITFKENCPDVRNTRVVDIIHELQDYHLVVDVHDPHANKEEVSIEYGIELIDDLDFTQYTAIILAVSHDGFSSLDWKALSGTVPVIFDVKGLIPKEFTTGRL
ncbi:MAG: nucleotide sugar dehydrogenase [Cyclobacteriaceae bacterium]|nr:nucleotide sugar dehydrogenase [Cyclobacteriaceae bacterium]